MTGETGGWLIPASVQPGGRPPAPGPLALVQSFINSHYDLEVDHGADLFATPRALRRWLLARRLIGARTRIGKADLERALTVREGLRELARNGGDQARSVDLLVDEATSGGGAAAALGLVLGIAAQAIVDGSWSRLKICPGEDCDWAFFDHSRNHTGRWCSMSVCGGRAKARSHYHRRRGD
jgi:predicted RNA-binding Zn ribbon-like protein